MIRLDLVKKIVIIDAMTPLDTVIMFISANNPDLNNWRIVPLSEVEIEPLRIEGPLDDHFDDPEEEYYDDWIDPSDYFT